MKVEGASAQGRPPLCRLKLRLWNDNDHLFNNGVNDKKITTLKTQLLNA